MQDYPSFCSDRKDLFFHENYHYNINLLRYRLHLRFHQYTVEDLRSFKEKIFVRHSPILKNPHFYLNLEFIREFKDCIDWDNWYLPKELKDHKTFELEFWDYIKTPEWSPRFAINFTREYLLANRSDIQIYFRNNPCLWTEENLSLFWYKQPKFFWSLYFPFEFETPLWKKFKRRWDWEFLSRNKHQTIDEAFVHLYGDMLSWKSLSMNPKALDLILQTPDDPRWNWEYVPFNPNLTLGNDNIEYIADKLHLYLKLKGKRTSFQHLVRLTLSKAHLLSEANIKFLTQERFYAYLPWDNLSSRVTKHIPNEILIANIHRLNAASDEYKKILLPLPYQDLINSNNIEFKKDSTYYSKFPLSQFEIKSATVKELFYIAKNDQIEWNYELIEKCLEHYSPNILTHNKGVYHFLCLNVSTEEVMNAIELA